MELLNLNLVLGVELVMLANNQLSCNYCLLSKKQHTLNIQSTKSITGNLSQVLDAIPKQQPIALVLSGKGIIHKNLQVATGLAENQIFQQAFPSVEPSEFYSQQFNQGPNFTLSLIRKQVVDELLDKCQRAGLSIYSLSLGGLVSSHIWAQLNCYDQTLQLDTHAFTLNEEKQLLNYTYGIAVVPAFPIKVVQQPIPATNIIAYAAAFQLILHEQLTVIMAHVPAVHNGFASLMADHKLKQRGLVFLGVIFVLLLISFSLFSYYNQENAQLAGVVGSQTANSTQLEVMKTNIANNEALLKQLNWNGGYNYGFLVNEIGRSMPKQLQLQALQINVYQTEQEQKDRLAKIKLIGTTTNLTAVNNWIYVLKEKPWVKSVQLLKYQESPETADYLFNLLIIY